MLPLLPLPLLHSGALMSARRISSKTPKVRPAKRTRRARSAIVTFDTVRQVSLSLDHVEEGTSYGTPAFKVRGALFIRLHQDFDSTIVVRTDFDQREELLAADP